MDDGPAELRNPGGRALPRLLDEDEELLPVLSLEFAQVPLVGQLGLDFLEVSQHQLGALLGEEAVQPVVQLVELEEWPVGMSGIVSSLI